ncbi:peptidoglycan-binding protein [Roseivirga sp. E12]|uniref:peptidoglycan-binding domain-containing protein n=1 Tax=Roseivirga sp. E12 TaxID=2819237 RepID=UPI001ABCB5F3|nr:peptidoglycan-binding domain-containing protein [Roseivirga sp. E12]MBO3698809.1 peptidoglycan-binding protein [Roseivirga sp. E12]
MKRLLTIVILLGVISYIAVQYLKDRRFNPPSAYDYPISEAIDKDYYDQLVVKEYYKTALEVGSYARSLWNNDGIDVRYMDKENFESTQATEYYELLRASAIILENKLLKSAERKKKGYNNDEIKMLEKGITPEDIEFMHKEHLLGLAIGSNGNDAMELQRMLNSKGDSIPVDGIFNTITRYRLRVFQTENGLFPSGQVDKETLKVLLK